MIARRPILTLPMLTRLDNGDYGTKSERGAKGTLSPTSVKFKLCFEGTLTTDSTKFKLIVKGSLIYDYPGRS